MPGACGSNCIGIPYFHWNAEGDDCTNLNDEYVEFRNSCPYPCNMTGWTVRDESSRNPYVFPALSMESEGSVTLYTGCGQNSGKDMYWCSIGRQCNSIWNNDADTLYLRNAGNELVLNYTYSGFA
jgi:competence protein ComEC